MTLVAAAKTPLTRYRLRRRRSAPGAHSRSFVLMLSSISGLQGNIQKVAGPPPEYRCEAQGSRARGADLGVRYPSDRPLRRTAPSACMSRLSASERGSLMYTSPSCRSFRRSSPGIRTGSNQASPMRVRHTVIHARQLLIRQQPPTPTQKRQRTLRCSSSRRSNHAPAALLPAFSDPSPTASSTPSSTSSRTGNAPSTGSIRLSLP